MVHPASLPASQRTPTHVRTTNAGIVLLCFSPCFFSPHDLVFIRGVKVIMSPSAPFPHCDVPSFSFCPFYMCTYLVVFATAAELLRLFFLLSLLIRGTHDMDLLWLLAC